MVKNQEYLEKKASYCLDLAKKLGATDTSINVGNSISETVNFRNKKLDESNRSDNLGIEITTYIGKKKSSISSSNLLKDNLKILIEKCIETTKNTPEDEFNSLPDKDLLANEIKDLNKVKRVVKVIGMVNCTPGFEKQPAVINGFSDFIVEIFGERGKHARSAVGMVSLPMNIAVEIEVVVEVIN